MGRAGARRDDDCDDYGDLESTIDACTAPVGYVTDDTDCDDDNATVYPDAAEFCDDLDNDCDGIVDDPSEDVCLPSDDGSLCSSLWGTDLGSVPAWTGAWDGSEGYIQLEDTCYGSLVVELRSAERLLELHEAQVISYLTSTRTHLSLTLNFKAPVLKEGIERVIYSL